MAKKILIIEDQPPIVKSLKTRLKALGHDVVTAQDGHEGVEKVKMEVPDLIITDLAMPKMTGNVVVRILKQSQEFQHIPIIMLSAFIRGNENESVEVPADAYVPKPFDANALMVRVQTLLEKAVKPKGSQ